MKVLFAVNSESVSEAIIKKYQKDYREILSYKNVYYFNAIQKEIQQDKSYDRIVISEDLEPFSNNNYEAIDKLIFERLDGISDEAHDSMGNEISIILICSERHTKGSSFLVKLFGIGVYNALLGNDRSFEEICRLINKTRTKKEAKMYYKIDTDDVNYKAENENEVSELEIQNIIAHFKKLGKNSEKYASSFENIAGQYTEEQLKIIINCLPINVKAILEETSVKYQEIMSVNGGVVRGIKSTNTEIQQAQVRTGIKIDLIENKIKETKITQPIVIPNSVKSKGSATAKKVISIQPNTQAVPKIKEKIQENLKVEKTKSKPIENKIKPVENQIKTKNVEPERKIVEKLVRLPDGRVVRKKVIQKVKPNDNLTNTSIKNETENKIVKPERKTVKSIQQDESNEVVSENSITSNDDLLENDMKKRRGRPRKNIEQEEKISKGKRGRPRKVDENQEEISSEDDLFNELTEENIFDTSDNKQDIENNNQNTFAEEVDLPELDELEDLNDEITSEDVVEESFDEFDEYDEYGKYETASAKDKEKIDEDNIFLDEEEDILSNLDDELDEEGDILSNLDDESDEEDDILSNLDDESDEEGDIFSDLEDESSEDDVLSNLDDENSDELIEALNEEENYNDIENNVVKTGDFDYSDNNYSVNENINYDNNYLESIEQPIDYSMSDLNSFITKDNKIVSFIGTSKNGVSFLINNLAAFFSSIGINTAILDMTKNKNSYYIYTDGKEELRKIAYSSIENLQNGVASGIKVKNNLTVYTALPNDGKDYSNAEPILTTLLQNHALILIDSDFDTHASYFANSQEIYLVQSMDILTIQPLTSFLRELKTQGILETEKVKVVINKELKVRGITNKLIIGGMSFYNDPAMAFMTELFNKDVVKYCSIPFEEMIYSKYLEALATCKLSINGYSKNFINKLRILGEMVYPLTSRQSYSPNKKNQQDFDQNNFSDSMNDTLSKMKKKI